LITPTKTFNVVADFPSDQYGIYAICRQCGHEKKIDTNRLSPDLPIPQMIKKLRCQSCDVRDIGISIVYELPPANAAVISNENAWSGEIRWMVKSEEILLHFVIHTPAIHGSLIGWCIQTMYSFKIHC